MITLTLEEQNDYNQFILPAISNAPTGTQWKFRDFFGPRSASPRLSRYLYEQITGKQGSLRGVLRLNGSRMSEGIVKI